MSRVSQTIKNLISGVSQQPQLLRLPEQLDEQVNGFSTESSGLQKRPPTLYVNNLGSVPSNKKPLVHIAKRDEDEKYVMMFDGTQVKVWDTDGNAKTVKYEGAAKSYITCSSPRTTLRIVTIADYTFIVNRSVTVQMSGALSAANVNTQGGTGISSISVIATAGSVQSTKHTYTITGGDDAGTYTYYTYYRTLTVPSSITSGAKYEVLKNGSSVGSVTPNSASALLSVVLTLIKNNGGYTTSTSTSVSYGGNSGWTSSSVPTFSIRCTVYSSGTSTSIVNTRGALINIKSGQYGRTYSITVNGTQVASFTTPNGDEAEHTKQIDTNYIRDQLYTTLQNAGWSVSKGNSWLYFYKSGTYISTLEVNDGFNGQGMFGFLDTTQKFTNLPSSAPAGYIVKVLGDASSGSDDYYVVYNGSEDVWEETCAPQIQIMYEASTMPHILVRNSDGTFTLKEAEWEPRKTGDDDSNPCPTFVDTTINDVFLFRNRLGFLADENIILSKSASFFDFWIASAVEVQDTDPIDIAVSNNKVCTLYYAIPFAEDLILFSNDTQFILSADGTLTPQNASAPFATNFSSDIEVKPVAAGRRLYFTSKRAQFTTAREYYVMDDTRGTKNAQDITSHVPSYLLNGVYAIYPCENENLLAYLTTGDTSRVYIYKYLFSEEARMQSSWSYWDFNGGQILGGGFINSEFYILVIRGSSLYLEKMTFTYNTKDYTDEPYRVFLDRKAISSAVSSSNYDSINDKTQLHIYSAYGGNVTSGVTYAVVTQDCHYYTFTYDEVKNDKCWVQGNLTGQKVVIGECYDLTVGLSRIMIKQRTDAGVVAEEEGRLQLTRLILNFSKSGYFEVHVDHNDPRDNHTYYHTARILGEVANRLGEIPLETGQIIVPLMSVNTNCNIYITSSAPTAISLIGFTWEGNYIKKTRSV